MADNANFEHLITLLKGDQTPRVWSLLVSLFGDLAQGEGDAISTQAVNLIMGAIGIKPEAVRVALHRLRKEGWLESRRAGRSSYYSLTRMGRQETMAASPRIYHQSTTANCAWLTVYPAGAPQAPGVAVAPQVQIEASKPNGNEVYAHQLTELDPIPDWIIVKTVSPRLLQQTHDAKSRLNDLATEIARDPELDASEIAALRVLVVHVWRRVALFIPDLPLHVFPPNWSGPDAQRTAHQLLDQLPLPTLEDIERSSNRAQLHENQSAKTF